MCRGTVSVGWDGRIYDCDFNQQLEMGLRWRHCIRITCMTAPASCELLRACLCVPPL